MVQIYHGWSWPFRSSPPQQGTLQTQTINLKPGWNFITLSVDPTDPSPHSVFETLLTDIIEIHGYDHASGLYSTFIPWWQDDLLRLRPNEGYIVRMRKEGTITITGVPVAPKTRHPAGWSLVALPVATTEEPITTTHTKLYPTPDSIWSWDDIAQTWKGYLKEAPAGISTLTTVNPETPYWLHIPESETTTTPSIRGNITYYHNDHLGGTNFVTSEMGEVIEEIEYYPYGRIRFTSSMGLHPDTNYSYTGKELDGESGLMYFEARYYDPVVGRFVSVDPLFVEIGKNITKLKLHPRKVNDYRQKIIKNSMQISLYHFTLNNPIVHLDPNGLATYNYSDETIYVKSEDDESVRTIEGTDDPKKPNVDSKKQDGFTAPKYMKGFMIKTTDYVDVHYYGKGRFAFSININAMIDDDINIFRIIYNISKRIFVGNVLYKSPDRFWDNLAATTGAKKHDEE